MKMIGAALIDVHFSFAIDFIVDRVCNNFKRLSNERY